MAFMASAVRRAARARRVTAPTRAGIHVRISDDKAGDELGVQRQLHDCRALAHQLGWHVVEEYVENSVSAHSGDARPTYDRLLDDLGSGHLDALIAWHPDRIYRRPQDLEGLIDVVEGCGAPIRCVMTGEIDLTTASGRMVARQLGVAARYEGERKAERLVSKHEELARDGKPSGGPAPFGYRWDDVPGPDGRPQVGPTGKVVRVLALDPAEAELIRLAADRVLAGELVSQVAAGLSAEGYRSRRGKLRAENLARVLTSGRIAGLRERYGEVVGPATWPAIVTEAEHRQLRAVLADPLRARTRPFTSALLGGGLAVCGRCGAALHSGRGRPSKAQRAAGEQGARVYLCASARGGCGKLQVRAAQVEQVVVAQVWEALSGGGLAEAVARRVPDGSAAQRDVDAIEAKLAALGVRWAEGLLTDAAHDAAQARLAVRLAEAQAKVGQSKRGELLRRFRKLGELRGAWPTLPLDDQRTVVALVVDRVVVAPAERLGRNFDPGRVEVVWRA